LSAITLNRGLSQLLEPVLQPATPLARVAPARQFVSLQPLRVAPDAEAAANPLTELRRMAQEITNIKADEPPPQPVVRRVHDRPRKAFD
jgi:hypothetical protein